MERLYYRLALGALNLLRGIALALPLRLVLGSADAIGQFIGRFFGRELMVSIAQLRFALGRTNAHVLKAAGHEPTQRILFGSPEEVKLFEPLTFKVFGHASRTFAEFLVVDKLLKDKTAGDPVPSFLNIEAAGTEHAWQTISHGKTAIALSAHVGNFELLAAYHVACGFRVSVVARNPNYASLGSLITRLRSLYGIETILRDDPGSSRKLIKAFKEPQILALLIDQDVQLENVFSPFFGLEAACPITLINLAVKFDLPVVSSFIVRTGPLHHRILTEPIDYDAHDPEAARSIVDTYNRRLEVQLKQFPEQWFWWHRRWRRRPGIDYQTSPEMLRSTSDYISWLRSLTPEDH